MKFAGKPTCAASQLPNPGGSIGLMPNAPFVRLKLCLVVDERRDPVRIAVQRRLVDDLAEAERDDGEVVTPQPQRRQADQDAGNRRDAARR